MNNRRRRRTHWIFDYEEVRAIQRLREEQFKIDAKQGMRR